MVRCAIALSKKLWPEHTLDYEGVSMSSRDANSKKAASTASTMFQDYYPEFLVSFVPILL